MPLVLLGFTLLMGYCGWFGRLPDEPATNAAATTIPIGSTPDWAALESITEGTTTYLVTHTDYPFTTTISADEGIEAAARKTLQKFFSQQSNFSGDELVISDERIQELIVPGHRVVRQYDQQYGAELAQRYGVDHETFYRGYAQLKIDEDFVSTAKKQIHQSAIRARLRIAGVSGIGLLALLAVLVSYLKIDHATRGFYSRRLQTIGMLLAIGILLAVSLVLRS